MSKKNPTTYTHIERRAEDEIDTFLQKVNGANPSNILQELRRISFS